MAEDLRYRVFELLVDGSGDSTELAWAAVEGDDALSAALGGAATPAPERPSVETVPAGAFLTSLTVEGFRGIGEKCLVTLSPRPGLVIINGRNGSGKSSLAEAFEFALTRTTVRSRLASRFGAQWRNLHHGDPCRVTIGLAQEGVGASTICAEWAPKETSLAAGRITFQPQGRPRQDGLSALGWERALETYRPILSYDELSQILRETDLKLHVSLFNMLGLELVSEAIDRVRVRLDPLKRPLTLAQKERGDLRKRCENTTDERAAQAATRMRTTQPDVPALRALITGATDAGPVLGTVRRILGYTAPDSVVIEAAAQRLSTAASAVEALQIRRSTLETQRRELLRLAVQWTAQRAEDQSTCPVCGEGVLDAAWRRHTEEVLQASDLFDTESSEAQSELRKARQDAARFTQTVVPELEQTLVDLTGQSAAAEASARWADAPTGDESLVNHLRTEFEPWRDTVAAWQSATTVVEQQYERTWQPLAVEIGAWLERYEKARADDAVRVRLEAALAQLTAVGNLVQRERLAPIVAHARQIWNELKHESNVDLVDIDLTGAGNYRKVAFGSEVDGTAAPALAVMSQGELLALALALFLPRAALAESPFRFIVLDDPVQAMDPAKVDGLARVLDQLALTRQVIVLTHDDRLSRAAQRLPTPPRILEVTRGVQSKVILRDSHRTVDRYLSDARGLALDEGLPEATCREILPALLRQALEAACYDRFYRTKLGEGTALAVVEGAWAAKQTTRERLELALDVDGRSLAQWRVPAARSHALRICSSGQHSALVGDIDEAIGRVSTTIRDLEAGRR